MAKNILRYLDVWAKLQTNKLRGYVETSEKAFEDAFNDFDAWAAEQVNGMTEDERDDFYQFHADKGFSLRDDFPRFGRHMALVGIYGYFEHTLISLCDRCEKILSLKVSVRRAKRLDVGTAKKYLKEEAKILLPTDGAPWRRFKFYRDIRNLIVHSDSQVPEYADRNSKPRKKFEEAVKATDPIEVNDFGHFTLSKEYCPRAVDTLEQFFDELLPVLP
ncbi:MAG: hypothetical protein KF708_06605 [Pirellulales bacterium]|nr:hypothetical protein [Pirellulales bacterium]